MLAVVLDMEGVKDHAEGCDNKYVSENQTQRVDSTQNESVTEEREGPCFPV
jgi:hypothetical protein